MPDEMNWISLLTFFGLVFLVSLSGALFKPGEWYKTLAKPGWTPPDWAFPVGWSILYVMIAIAGWRVWEQADSAMITPVFAVFGVQLFLNAIWSGVFFGMRRMDWALINVGALWLSILANIVAFWMVEPLSGLLLVPYLGWVTFAASLNYAVYRLNPDQGRGIPSTP